MHLQKYTLVLRIRVSITILLSSDLKAEYKYIILYAYTRLTDDVIRFAMKIIQLLNGTVK